MTTALHTPATKEPGAKSSGGSVSGTALIFAEWCLQREAPRWPPRLYRLSAMIPVLIAWWIAVGVWQYFRRPCMGDDAIRHLLLISGATIIVGGIQFASRAVCWELSVEMRDLVRLTSVDPRMLLWASTLSRWWTIGWSLVFLMPLAFFARTLGGVTDDQLTAGLLSLLMIWGLTCGIGMLINVLVADIKNPEKTASSGLGLCLFLYNVMFVSLSQAYYWGHWLITGNASLEVERLSRRIAYSAPAVTLWNALISPSLFTATEPGYWIHGIAAVACALFATWMITVRYRSEWTRATPEASIQSAVSRESRWRRKPATIAETPLASASQSSALPADSNVTAPGRPRCSEHPFYWKDVYILSDDGKRLNMWSLFHWFAAFGVILLETSIFMDPERVLGIVIAVASIMVAAGLISMRFDALLTVEFRDRTWGSLMLLPVDPCYLLSVKLQATLWEQRFALVPVGTAITLAIAFGRPYTLAVILIASVISTLACGLLCQISCVNQFLGKCWWLGPCQVFGFVVLLVISVAIWSFSGSWVGCIPTSLFLVGVLLVMQFQCVNKLARGWVEP